MFVIGATQAESFTNIRKLTPNHFYLVPGVGAQGGSLPEISEKALIPDGGLLVNASRAIIYASEGEDFAAEALARMQQRNITQLVVTQDGAFNGFIHLHDLLREGLV